MELAKNNLMFFCLSSAGDIFLWLYKSKPRIETPLLTSRAPLGLENSTKRNKGEEEALFEVLVWSLFLHE